MDQVSVMPAARVFRRHPLRTAAGALLLNALLAAGTLFLLPTLLPRGMSISTRGVVVLVVATALTVIVWGGAFWFRNIRVIVRPDVVEIGRPGSMTVYRRDAAWFRSKVTEHFTNGLRSGTTRALVVVTGGRETEIELPGFSRSAFSEMMAVLSPVAQPEPVDRVAAARARAQLPMVFTIDGSAEERFARRLRTGALAFAGTALAVVAVAIGPGFLESELSGLVLLAPFAAVAAAGFAIGAAQRRRLARSVPAQITVGHQGLRIGDADHPYAQLTRIWLTPPAYPVRRIRLQRAAGRTVTHLLGSSRVTMTPSYDDLVSAVRAHTAHLPGLVSFDLE